MAQNVGPRVQPPPPLNVKKGAEDWKLFKQMWQNYCIVAKVKQDSDNPDDVAYVIALFLHTIGVDGLSLYNAMQLPEGHKVKDILKAFDDHFIGKTNETYERYIFNKREQHADESFEDYVAALRTQAKACNFCECLSDSLLRDRIVLGIRDSGTRKRLLQEAKLDLATCIDMCRAAEATQQQLRTFKSTSASAEETYAVSETGSKAKKWGKQRSSHQTHSGFSCKFCGKNHPLRKEQCPAWGKVCKNCQRRNHFAAKCPRKSVHLLEDESGSEDETLLAVDCKQNKVIKAEMIIQGEKVVCQVDCGASVNVIPAKHIKNVPITTTKKTLHTYNKTTLTAKGMTMITVKNPKTKKKYKVEFVVVDEDLIPLLGKNTSEKMGLITVNYSEFESVAKVTTTSDNPHTDHTADVLENFAEVFDDRQGNLPGIAHLEVDPTITPVTSPSGRVPLAMKAKVKKELDQLTDRDVITPVEEPTDWTSRMVIATKKSGELRICLDPRPLNKALKRERYALPVMEDILPKLANAKVFSKLDLSSAYWHVHLDEESSRLTTFQTPFGRYRWKRLPFGTSVSSEIFQKRLTAALDNLDGVIGVSDDIVVYGSGDTEAEALLDHDRNLTRLLDRCLSLGMKLNKDKAEIRRTEITFLGHRITCEGLKIDPDKVTAILQMKKPENVEDVRRFCGFVQYLSKFLPKLSETLEPIRQLTRDNVEWTWTSTHEKAFCAVQKMVTEAPVLVFYNPAEELTIQCDSSQSGLGAVLMQNGKPIAYASRSLTDTETRYAQIEKEMLAIVYALDKFHQYTFGRHTTVESDHKPLESIMRKSLSAAPRRLQGMMLRIQDYDITVRYKKGKEMYLADTLSRAFISSSENTQGDFEYVNMVNFLLIREERLTKMKEETEKDDTLQKLKEVILHGWPEEKTKLPAELIPYFSFRDEMSVQDGLLFKGERVVVPSSLRPEMKAVVHSTHTGIDGCLKRARESLFWPGMTGDIKQFISTCEICQTYQSANQPETLHPHELPSRQWEKIGIDLFELDGTDYMITVDYLTNYWEIDRLENTKTSTVIRKLKAHFARYGLPCIIISDNGPQFTSENFKDFAIKFDFEHRTSSPYNSKSNGKAESAVKTAKSLLRKNKAGDQFLALLNYRNTPSQSTGTSPAQRFFNRRTRTLLPISEVLLKPKVSVETDIEKLRTSQKKQKQNFDKRAKDLPPLEEGDAVVMQPVTLGKKKWSKATVVHRAGRSYDVEIADGTIYCRNRVHLRKVADQAPAPQPDILQPARQTQPSGTSTPIQPAVPPEPPVTRATPAASLPTMPASLLERPGTPPVPTVKATKTRPSTRPPVTSPPSPMKSAHPSSKSPVCTRSGRAVKENKMKDFVYAAK